jgi:hypothetical protein
MRRDQSKRLGYQKYKIVFAALACATGFPFVTSSVVAAATSSEAPVYKTIQPGPTHLPMSPQAVKSHDQSTIVEFASPGGSWGYVMPSTTKKKLVEGADRATVMGFVSNTESGSLKLVPASVVVDDRALATSASPAAGGPIACIDYSIYGGSSGDGGPDLAFPNPYVFDAIADSCYYVISGMSAPVYHAEGVSLGACTSMCNSQFGWNNVDNNDTSVSHYCITYSLPVAVDGTSLGVGVKWSSAFSIQDSLTGYTFPYLYQGYGSSTDTSTWNVGYPWSGVYNYNHAGGVCS